jgi:hypothetical protein
MARLSRPLAFLAALGLVAGTALFAAGPGVAADTPTPSASAAATSKGVSLIPIPSIAKPGERIQVRGSGWPAGIAVQVALCGNLALNGTSDCYGAGAASAATDKDGNFSGIVTAGTPPAPCPCVIYANSFSTPTTAKQAFTLTGATNKAPTSTTSKRTVDLGVKITGANIATWFGGAAKRTVTMTVKNTGDTPLTNPNVTITSGKGSDPTSLLAQPKIGNIAVGQTVQYSLPFTLQAPTFGQYRVKVQITGLDELATATATTSTYPWALIVLAWLLLQPLLLGLYKRRPVAEDLDDDPFGGPAPMPVATNYDDDPLLAGFDPSLVGAGTAAGVVAANTYDGVPNDPAGYASYSTAIVPRAASTLVPNYRPVFGVTDLRAYLDPGATTPRATAAPRIVLGGVVPRVAPQQPQAPEPPPYDPGI